MKSNQLRIYFFYVFITFITVISISIFMDVTFASTVEALSDMSGNVIDTTSGNKNDIKMDPAGDFCNSHVGSSDTLLESCGKLTNQNCNLTSCCVMLNGTKCVPGNKDGPTFKTTDGKNIDIDYYHYQNKKYQVQYATSNV